MTGEPPVAPPIAPPGQPSAPAARADRPCPTGSVDSAGASGPGLRHPAVQPGTPPPPEEPGEIRDLTRPPRAKNGTVAPVGV